MLTVRCAGFNDLDEMMRIYAQARGFMKQSGNATQWGDHFPPETLIREDIAKGRSYVVTDDDRICGAFAFIIGEDPTYQRIEDGAWGIKAVTVRFTVWRATAVRTAYSMKSCTSVRAKFRICGLTLIAITA